MGWRETWRETVESFLRELRADEVGGAAGAEDPAVRAVAAARAESAVIERELHRVADRLAEEEAAAGVCRRRRQLAERIGDTDTATIAARFQHRHEERAALLRRKGDLLRDERALAHIELDELMELMRTLAVDPAGPADRGDPARESAPARVDVDSAGFRELDERRRERAAAERLEEMKRRGV